MSNWSEKGFLALTSESSRDVAFGRAEPRKKNGVEVGHHTGQDLLWRAAWRVHQHRRGYIAVGPLLTYY